MGLNFNDVPDETLLRHLREVAKRGFGVTRVKNLKEAASCSVGLKHGVES